MMQVFFHNLGSNLRNKRAVTLRTIGALLLAGVIIGFVIDRIFWTGPIIYAVSIPATLWGASRIPHLEWFFGTRTRKASTPGQDGSTAETSESVLRADGTHPTVKEAQRGFDVALLAIKPRETPVGVTLVSYSKDHAIVRVKSVVHFWCWFAPLAFVLSTLFVVPFGAWISWQSYRSSVEWFDFKAEQAVSASITGGLIAFGLCVAGAIFAFIKNRPDVTVEITPDLIRYGETVFDRKFFGGMTIGYKSDEAEIRTNITDDRFGVTRLRFNYGSWGEDLKYMVNSYYAVEIVIFLNQVINAVGVVEPTGDNANQGKKTELL